MNWSREDELDSLRRENDRLRLRVAQLEAGLAEYRRQMNEVLRSSSWRVTSPLRMAAGRIRRARTSVVSRRIRPQVREVPLHGLFPPSASGSRQSDELLATLAAPPSALVAPHRPPQPQRSADVLVVAHVYYPEVWSDIADRLVRMPEPFDLVVTLVEGAADWLEPGIVTRFPRARVEVVPNRGRDMAPLVSLANRGVLDGYRAVLKVHTKRSPHRLDGDAWRVRMLDSLLASPKKIGEVLETLRRDDTVGLVAPEGSVAGPEWWGRNLPVVEALAQRMPVAFEPEHLRFASGSMYWARPWVVQRLADLALEPTDFQTEAGQTDGTTAHALERMTGIIASSSGLDVISMTDIAGRLHRRRHTPHRPRVVAFYLPQYHRIPENDQWWGDGFTDWDNVDKAVALFDSHAQPQRPGALGHYDLSDPDVLRAQADLARRYGIDGFVLHYYWFDGRRLLDKPLANLLADRSIDVPFALSWANEPWTRRWDGLDSDVLLAQTYSPDWVARFYADLWPALEDPRYLRVDGRPLLMIYRASDLPAPEVSLPELRKRARRDGHDLYLVAVLPSPDAGSVNGDHAAHFDALCDFPPGSGLGLHSIGKEAGLGDLVDGDVLSYEAAVEGAGRSPTALHGRHVHPGLFPGWDNTPRRGSSGYVFHGANPWSFRRWVADSTTREQPQGSRGLVFVNAWNEWAESAHLEPCARFGPANLEAVFDVLGPRPTS